MKKIFMLMSFTALAAIASLYADSVSFAFLEVKKVKAKSSSTLVEKNRSKSYYSPINAFDGDIKSAWCYRNKKKPEFIEVSFEKKPVNGFSILNGAGNYKTLYFNNGRIKKAKVTLRLKGKAVKSFVHTFKDNTCGQTTFGGKVNAKEYCADNPTKGISFKKCVSRWNNACYMNNYDGGGEQVFFRDRITIDSIRIDVLSVYPGKKYKDVCIAEFSFLDFVDATVELFEDDNPVY